MPKIIKLTILIISEVIFLFFLILILPSVFIKERPGVKQTSYNETLSLDIKNSFNQEFITDQDNLRSVSVLLKNPALVNKSPIKFEIKDQSNTTIRILETSGISVGDPSWITFEFPYMNSKKGDKILIRISTDTPKPDNLFIYGNSKDKSVNFKTTFTTKSIKESFNENLKQQINKFKARDIFQTNFYLLLLLLINIFIFI